LGLHPSFANETFRNSLIYRAIYSKLELLYNTNVVKDGARRSTVAITDGPLGMEEVFISQSLLIRIYKLHRPDPFGRSFHKIIGKSEIDNPV
jgi:hypothetical protein